MAPTRLLRGVIVQHTYGDDASQFGELSRPAGQSHGTVVVIHGGFWRSAWDLSLGRPLAAHLVARGYTVWNLEYRRVGEGGGWPATFDDVAAGIDQLAALDVDTSAVVAIGHSAGGQLAVWAAGRNDASVPVTAVVSQAGVLDLVGCAQDGVGAGAALDLMGGSPAELPERYRQADPMSALPLAAPVLCVHSRDDADVPFRYSADYVAAATAAGGRARLVEAAGDHFTVIDPASTAWAVVVEALPGLLGR